MLALLDSFDETRNLPTAVKSVASSASAASFRIFLMPIDAAKTILQVRWCGERHFAHAMLLDGRSVDAAQQYKIISHSATRGCQPERCRLT